MTAASKRRHYFCVRSVVLVMAITAACLLSVTLSRGVTIRASALLGCGAALLWFKVRSESLQTIQRVFGVYLCCVPVVQLQTTFAAVRVGQQIHISYALIVSLMCVVALMLPRSGNDNETGQRTKHISPSWGWWVGIAVMFIHALVTSAILWGRYGHSFEQSIISLGWVGLYSPLWLGMWIILNQASWRRCVSLVLIIYFGICFVGSF